MFAGSTLVAIDANMNRLYDFMTMNIGVNRQVCTIRRDILQQVVGNRPVVMVRIPFNFAPAENQIETLLDELMSMGYRIVAMSTPSVGPYYMIYNLQRS